MLGGVGRILKLLQDDAAGNAVTQLLSSLDGTRHTVLATCQSYLSTISLHKVTTLDTHRLRHRQDELVALDSTDECQSYACVSTRRLDDGGTGLQQSFLFCVFYHRQSDAVFHTAARIEEFHLGDNRSLKSLGL